MPDGPLYLIDTSVWARLADVEVAAAFDAIVDLVAPFDILICPPVAAEIGFSARTPADHATLMRELDAFEPCAAHPAPSDVLTIQNRLWTGGLLRAAGATDTVVAAYSVCNDATLLHYDRDFEHIATVIPSFRHQWVVPRGSVD
ncbi:MAG TPA: PIN domain-containing protein [Pseudolysinimonas sp.]